MEQSDHKALFPPALTPLALQLQKDSRDKDYTTLVWDLVCLSGAAGTNTRSEHEAGVEAEGSSKYYHAKIYLKSSPASATATSATSEANQQDNIDPLKPSSSKVMATIKTGKQNATDSTTPQGGDDDVIEASVLQYQRQLRKTQAAKRAGTRLTEEQLDVVYQDADIICVNKPAGVLTVPGINNQDSIANLVFRSMVNSRKEAVCLLQEPLPPFAQQQREQTENSTSATDNNDNSRMCTDACSMTVHRLDMDTSGLVVFGKTKPVVSALHQVFRRESENKNGLNKNKKGNRNQRRKHQKQNQQEQQQQPQNVESDVRTNSSQHAGSQQQNGGGRGLDESAVDLPPLTTTDTAIDNPSTAVIKEYEALVCGHLPLHIQSGHIDLPLQRDVHHPPFMRVSTPHSEALARQVVDALRARNWTKLSKRNPKPSQTEFRVVAREYYECNDGRRCVDVTDETSNDKKQTPEQEGPRRFPVTRLSLTPVTGRTHQLRVHCAAMGFPIVGDPAYGVYGESAFCGGLYHNSIQVMSINKQRDAAPTDCVGGEQKISSSSSIWRASLSLQKKIMELYPPGEKSMCLHARRLGIPHPTLGEMMIWEVPPKF